jgi:sirohydrochlorin cobaltochelatase
MSNTALVLAAHGSRHEPTVNAQTCAWAAQAAERTEFDEVAVAFHQGSPAYSEVLDSLAADEVTVVPVMTSAGYYSDVVLPRELARNRRFPHLTVRKTVPVGLHPDIPVLIANRANVLFDTYGHPQISAQDCTLAIVGHGTPRHTASRNSTLSLAKQLRAMHSFGEVIALFLDDQPAVEQLLTLATRPNVLVIPFLIAAGPHATLDVPRRIGMSMHGMSGPPFVDSIGGKRILCDVPFGSYPGMIDLIIDLASPAASLNSLYPGHSKKEVA